MSQDKVREAADLVAVVALAVQALDLDYEEEKGGLYLLLLHIEALLKEASTPSYNLP